ncbi:ribonuclease HI [Williamsia sp. R60]
MSVAGAIVCVMYDDAHIDGDLLVRRKHRFSAPLLPSDDLVAAPVHIALVSWRQSTGDAQMPVRLWWLVVTSDSGRSDEATKERLYHSTRGDGGWDAILDSVWREIAAGSGPAWVVVPKKRYVTAEKLHEQGFPVTRGACEDNRAIARAIERMQDYLRLGRSITLPGQARSTSQAADDSATHGFLPSVVPQWFPSISDVNADPVDSLIVATDASVDRNGATAVAAISDRGEAALNVTSTEGNTSESELHAISLAIEVFAEHVRGEMCVLSDSTDAVTVAKALVGGRVPVEGYRGISDAAMVRFEEAWQQASCGIAVFHVKGHAGHYLNEAADDVAFIGRLASQYPQLVVERELRQRLAAISSAVAAVDESETRIPAQTYVVQCQGALAWSIGDRVGVHFGD